MSIKTEQHITQKQVGAYYTGEDITAYISKNTLLPFLLDVVAQKYPVAFTADGPVWSLLREQPERYIYAALRHGRELPFPQYIEAGRHDITRRGVWNERAPAEYALPLETWREVVSRHQRYAEVMAHISAGEVCSANDLITCNLDIWLFARDAIKACEDAGLLLAWYESIESLTILDPTCGSGAFLLAALTILEPLYEACLESMQRLISACDRQPEALSVARRGVSAAMQRFWNILQEVQGYPSRSYFVDATIIARNLYGVDLMEAAAEICRQRLRMRLLAQVQEDIRAESLPAFTCNIRTGNALVGCTTDAEVLVVSGPASSSTQQSFHWYIEFPKILQRGGFDVILGNPPYVAYSKVKDTYQIRGYMTQSCGNLYAYTMERALALLRQGGRCGMIAPVSAISSVNYQPLSRLLLQRQLWLSSYSNRPGKLFSGVEQRLAILLICNMPQPALFSSAYQHWYESERAYLFALLTYTPASTWLATCMPLKSGSALAEAIFARLACQQGFPLLNCQREGAAVWVHNGPTYWVRALAFAPDSQQTGSRSRHYLKLPVASQEQALILAALLSSSTFYFFYKMISNCRDLGQKELRLFPLGQLQPALEKRLERLGRLLAERLQATGVKCSRRYASGVSEYEEYYPARAKAILDQVDRVLAEHYGFTDEEYDFIINYDIKYRMGRDKK